MTEMVNTHQLSDAPFFYGLTQAQKDDLLASATLRVVKAGTPILRQGEMTNSSFLIVKGRVEVCFVDLSGNQVTVHTAGPGEMMGEIEALSGLPCAASCVALVETLILIFPAKALHTYMSPQILVSNLCTALHQRLMREIRNRTADYHYNAEQRLRMHLRQLTDNNEGEVRISQSQLGVMVGCSRQTVNRMLGDLRDQGVIGLGRNAVRVLDRDRLAEGTPLID